MLSHESRSQAKLGIDPLELLPPTEVADQVVSTLALLRRMVDRQMQTLKVARRLMLVQGLAERHCSRVGSSVDEAAASDQTRK
jgi:hypothetical protein